MRRHRHPVLRATVTSAAIALLVAGCGSGDSGGASAGKSLEDLRAAGTIRVANTQVNPPFSFVDGSGKVVGFDVDVAEEVAKRLGIDDVEYVVGTFQTFIPGLQSDKWDAVIAGLTVTEERQKQVQFGCPYLVNEISLFAQPGSDKASGVRGNEDLAGLEVAVTAGGVQEEQVGKVDGAKVATYDNATLALRDIATGRADVYVGSKFTGAYLADKNDLDVAPVDATLPGLLSSEITAMAFPKGQKELTDAANKALDDMIADGTLTDISRQWFGDLDVVEGLKKLPAC